MYYASKVAALRAKAPRTRQAAQMVVIGGGRGSVYYGDVALLDIGMRDVVCVRIYAYV